eukprot:2784636-Prymnesium_polylepis.1
MGLRPTPALAPIPLEAREYASLAGTPLAGSFPRAISAQRRALLKDERRSRSSQKMSPDRPQSAAPVARRPPPKDNGSVVVLGVDGPEKL